MSADFYLIKYLDGQASLIFERLHESIGNDTERNYWQGRLDELVNFRNYLKLPAVLIEH